MCSVHTDRSIPYRSKDGHSSLRYIFLSGPMISSEEREFPFTNVYIDISKKKKKNPWLGQLEGEGGSAHMLSSASKPSFFELFKFSISTYVLSYCTIRNGF